MLSNKIVRLQGAIQKKEASESNKLLKDTEGYLKNVFDHPEVFDKLKEPEAKSTPKEVSLAQVNDISVDEKLADLLAQV
jgi:hypothetical protein